MQPTSQPSAVPSSQPSAQPSSQPSSQPSTVPSSQPSTQPSSQPSSCPSSQPSAQPSSQPSAVPSSQPSSRPSGQPSSQPSTQPSSQPSVQPSSMPTGQPSGQPSSQPSSQPSTVPSAQPSAEPSSQPSVQPSAIPSSQPSTQPSSEPSSQPTSVPSTQPSGQPTGSPTGQPSGQPSGLPTSQPSSRPSSQPSSQPSSRPSSQPSSKPSTQPSSQPSSRPTSQPTTQPSSQPSSQPTTQPSSQPTMQPTTQPTTQPSSQPSTQPSSQPSTQPTSQPSGQPSSQPSSQPTAQPSSQPTTQPTTQPSGQPTTQPTSQPSTQPSSQPSTQPTRQPSSQPTTQPSAQPSSQPTTQPSSQPTLSPTTALRFIVRLSVGQGFQGVTKAAYLNDSTAFNSIQNTVQKVIGNSEARIKVNRLHEIYRSIYVPPPVDDDEVYRNVRSKAVFGFSSAASLISFEEAQVDKGKEKEGQSTLSFVEESIQTEDVIDVPVLVMNYTLSFYAGDIAPLANASFAVRVVSERLQAATSSGEYDVILREEAASRNSVSLASASVDNRTLTFNSYVSAFVHSGHPTSQPSGQPSSSPSSQPSSQPTSSPTLVPATKWRNRLQEELHARYDEEKHRNGRSIYSELMVWGEVLYGGQDEWSHFLLKDVRLALNSRKLSGLSLILANGSDTAAAVEVSCTEETALDYLSDAVQNPLWNLLSSSPTTSPFTTTTEVKSILCGSDRWAIQYCATAQQYESSTTSSSDYYSSIIYPSLCVNCSSPCNQTCQSSVVSSSGRMSGRLPVNESCPESGGSYFKILTFSTEEEEQSGRYFVVTFSTLWGAVLLLCCWNLFRGGTDRVSSTWRVVEESSGQVKKAFWKLKRMRASSQISPISSHSDAIQAVQKFFAWCSEPSYPVVSSFLHTLLSQHRDLK
eukprot:scaffold119_cov219-Ochromonas_danica.AAC.1